MNSFNGLRGMPGPCTEWLCWATEGTAITGNAGRGMERCVVVEGLGGGTGQEPAQVEQNRHPTYVVGGKGSTWGQHMPSEWGQSQSDRDSREFSAMFAFKWLITFSFALTHQHRSY